MRLTGSSRNRYGRRGWTKPAGWGPAPPGRRSDRSPGSCDRYRSARQGSASATRYRRSRRSCVADHSRITGTSSAERRRRSMAMNSDSSSVHAGCSIKRAEVQPLLAGDDEEPDVPVGRRLDAGNRHPTQLVERCRRHRARTSPGTCCARDGRLRAARCRAAPRCRSRARGNTPKRRPRRRRRQTRASARRPPSAAHARHLRGCHTARHGLQDEIRGRAIGPWAVQPEGRDRDRGQLRMASVQLFPRVGQRRR